MTTAELFRILGLDDDIKREKLAGEMKRLSDLAKLVEIKKFARENAITMIRNDDCTGQRVEEAL